MENIPYQIPQKEHKTGDMVIVMSSFFEKSILIELEYT